MKVITATSTGVEVDSDLHAEVEVDRFPDGELYVRIVDNLEGEDVAIIGNSYPDEGIIELLLLIDAVEEFKPNSMRLVIPYFGYGRQDRIFKMGEALSARAICRSLRVGEVALIDPHSSAVKEFFEGRVRELSAIPLLARWMRGKVDLIVAPDEGGAKRAERAAGEIGVDFMVMHKERKTSYDVEVAVEEEIKGKRVGIVDDIISTGGTMVRACSALRERGADEIYLACSHGLFLGDSLSRLKGSCDGLATTDSLKENLNREVELIRLAPLVSSYLAES